MNLIIVVGYLSVEFAVWSSLRSKQDSSVEARNVIAIVQKEFWLLIFSEVVTVCTLRFHYRSWHQGNLTGKEKTGESDNLEEGFEEDIDELEDLRKLSKMLPLPTPILPL